MSSEETSANERTSALTDSQDSGQSLFGPAEGVNGAGSDETTNRTRCRDHFRPKEVLLKGQHSKEGTGIKWGKKNTHTWKGDESKLWRIPEGSK